jgi:DNA-binding NarL/FixJ family response regulator
MTPSRIRVLIAEDDVGVREVLASVVRSESAFELAGAVENASQAIAAAARDLPDVALVDVRMPGGGVRAARGIKRASPHTRVIAFSAQDDPPTRQDMFDAGADGYLVKGSLVTAIIASIQRAGIESANSRQPRAA